jgi:hypothetical protein
MGGADAAQTLCVCQTISGVSSSGGSTVQLFGEELLLEGWPSVNTAARVEAPALRGRVVPAADGAENRRLEGGRGGTGLGPAEPRGENHREGANEGNDNPGPEHAGAAPVQPAYCVRVAALPLDNHLSSPCRVVSRPLWPAESSRNHREWTAAFPSASTAGASG